jgi:hypothetical protein
MAEVFRAHEPRPSGEPRVVVVKRMLPSLANEPGARDMFEEEARLGALVRHENVVRVLGFGESSKQPYLALEHVAGLDLWRTTRWLTRSGKTLGVELAIYVIRELLAGLHAVHEARDTDGRPLGLVHRDVSPSNVLLSLTGEVKLGDFGIAQALLRESYPQASTNDRAKGKLGYLAPEQVRGLPSDRRADVFAAAVIAAELLMGRPLFAGGSELAVLLAIRDAQVKPFVDHARTLPRGLGETILEALARDPEQRTPTAGALRDSLALFEEGPKSAVRTALAGVVSEAHAARSLHGSQQTMAAVRADAPPPTPVARGGATDAATGDAPSLDYYVQTSDGQTIGPVSYAKVIEAIALGRFGVTDLVQVRGGPFLPLSDYPDLHRHVPASSTSERTALRFFGDRDNPGEPDREWSLDDGAIVRALGGLVLERASGLLLCEQAGVRKEIYLSGGVPEFVTSNLASELLGEFLVARSVISRGELDMALAVMPRFEGRLGDTLTGLGLVEPVHLFRQIALQVQEKLLEIFGWTSGRATLWRGIAKPESAFPLGLDPWRIMVDGVERRLARGLDDPFSGRAAANIMAVRPPPGGLDGAQLPACALTILEITKRPARLTDVLARTCDPSGRDPHAGRRELALLLAVGAVRWG